VFDSSASHGQKASVVSPPNYLAKARIITVAMSLKIRPDDDWAAPKVIIDHGDTYVTFIFRESTDGFVTKEFCVGAGEAVLILEATWGRHSSPFIAIDDVTVTETPCSANSLNMKQHPETTAHPPDFTLFEKSFDSNLTTEDPFTILNATDLGMQSFLRAGKNHQILIPK
jgi:hypothetical protein